MQDLTPQQLQDRLDAGETPLLLDVREEWEFAICRLAESVLMPMGRVPELVGSLPRDRDIVVICHHGVRSRVVVDFCERSGLDRVFNLVGGVAAWAADIDPELPVY